MRTPTGSSREGLTSKVPDRLKVEYIERVDIDTPPLPDQFDSSHIRRSLIAVAVIVLVVAAAVVLLPGLGSLRARFAGAQPGWLGVAVVLQILSCASYVLAFRVVFCRRMSWTTSAEIGLAELAANSLFSVGGAGGLALGAWILNRGGVDRGHIARRTVAFFLITSLANVGFLALAGVLLAAHVLPGSPGALYGLLPAAVGFAAIGGALGARPLSHRIARRVKSERVERALTALGDGVSEALHLLRTRQPALGIGAAGYMLFDVAVLGVCFTAFGNDVPPLGVLLLAYLIGQLGGLLPIPGGIGGVDGGLIGTLVLYGVSATDAAVAVLAYRGILLAVPALLGLPALAILRRRLQTEAHDIAVCSPGQEVDVLGRGSVAPFRTLSP
ncbi:MAG: putative heme transporter [Solirubrobacterales bacterium]|nr:putative heme transporter [Solirubrobacterales bacterium]